MKHGFANEVNNNIFSCPNNLKVSTYFKVSYGTPIKRKTLKNERDINQNISIRADVYETLCPNICLPIKITWKLDAKVKKGGIIQPNIYRNLPRVNRVIYTIDTVCEP